MSSCPLKRLCVAVRTGRWYPASPLATVFFYVLGYQKILLQTYFHLKLNFLMNQSVVVTQNSELVNAGQLLR